MAASQAPLTQQNGLKPAAVVIGIVNQHIGDRMVKADRLSGYLRSFATHRPDDGRVTVFLINKSEQPVATELSLNGLSPTTVVSRVVYAGTDYYDLNPVLTTDTNATLHGNRVLTVLPGISLTVLTLR